MYWLFCCWSGFSRIAFPNAVMCGTDIGVQLITRSGSSSNRRPAGRRAPVVTDQVRALPAHRVHEPEDVRGEVRVGVVLRALRSSARAVAALVRRQTVESLASQPLHQRLPHPRCLRKAVQKQHRRARPVLARAKRHPVGPDVSLLHATEASASGIIANIATPNAMNCSMLGGSPLTIWMVRSYSGPAIALRFRS